MDFEQEIAGWIYLVLVQANAGLASFLLWANRKMPGVREWLAGLWVTALAVVLLTLPGRAWDVPLAPLRNGASITGSALLALGCARFLGRPASLRWLFASLLVASPFILSLVPGISGYASRAGIVSLMSGSWFLWAAWQWAFRESPVSPKAARFAAVLFGTHAAFSLTRACFLFLFRPADIGAAGLTQAVTYIFSGLYQVVLGLTLWILADLRRRAR